MAVLCVLYRQKNCPSLRVWVAVQCVLYKQKQIVPRCVWMAVQCVLYKQKQIVPLRRGTSISRMTNAEGVD